MILEVIKAFEFAGHKFKKGNVINGNGILGLATSYLKQSTKSAQYIVEKDGMTNKDKVRELPKVAVPKGPTDEEKAKAEADAKAKKEALDKELAELQAEYVEYVNPTLPVSAQGKDAVWLKAQVAEAKALLAQGEDEENQGGANTDPKDPVDPLTELTIANLKELAEEKGIDLGNAKKKDEIIAVINASTSEE